MYNPQTYLTKEVLSEVLAEFIWPDEYIINKEDCTVDGIKVRFPKCIIFFREGFESDMSFYISNPLSKDLKYWSSFELIHYIYKPSIKKSLSCLEPNIKIIEPFASLAKVRDGVRNICILIQFYLKDCIRGDFSLIEKYKREHPEFPL